MKRNLSLLFSAMFLGACANTTPSVEQNVVAPFTQGSLNVVQAIPLPSAMKADVTVNGRVSQVNHIDVAFVGKQIPFTFSDGKVANTEGFDWYVSKHFALKTDYPAERAKFFLELLELSYPYYVEFFGMEPANIANQRIASTYATSNGRLRDAMFDDGFNRGIHHNAGGEAMYYNWVGYSFPTERPQHQRYIAIHETMHSYQMALGNYPWTPSWHGEGLGDSTANHVFDSERKQLAVFGHDVPIFDMMSRGIGMYEKEQPTIVDIHNRKPFDRGLNVLFVQFMFNNPEYSQYLKIYHQEVMRQQTDSNEKSLEILQSVVPNWDKLESEFAVWVSKLKETHEASPYGPWEIDGNMYYKRKSNYDYAPQRLGFAMTPGEKLALRPYQLDYPVQLASDLVLSAERGVDEPTLAYEISFNPEQLNQGSIGMALGTLSTEKNAEIKKGFRGWKDINTDLDEQLRVLVKEGNTLELDARNFGGELVSVTLPKDMVAALKAQAQPKLGVSMQMQSDKLVVTVKAEDADTFETEMMLTAAQFSNLTKRPFGLVSANNQHGITPFIDDGRDDSVDYSKGTAANAWGFSGDMLAQRFARANWKAGKDAPKSWHAAFERLNKAALNIETADAEIAAVEALMPSLIKAGKGMMEAQAELSGIRMQLDWLGQSKTDMKEYAILTNYSKQDITATLRFKVAGINSKTQKVSVKAGETVNVLMDAELLAKGEQVAATLTYDWHGVEITQQDTQRTTKYNGYEMPELGAQYKDGALHIGAKLHGPFAGATKGIVTFDFYHGEKKESFEQKITLAPYEVKSLNHSFKVAEKEVDHDAWYEVTVVADVDGEVLTVRKRLPYVPAKFNR